MRLYSLEISVIRTADSFLLASTTKRTFFKTLFEPEEENIIPQPFELRVSSHQLRAKFLSKGGGKGIGITKVTIDLAMQSFQFGIFTRQFCCVFL